MNVSSWINDALLIGEFIISARFPALVPIMSTVVPAIGAVEAALGSGTGPQKLAAVETAAGAAGTIANTIAGKPVVDATALPGLVSEAAGFIVGIVNALHPKVVVAA